MTLNGGGQSKNSTWKTMFASVIVLWMLATCFSMPISSAYGLGFYLDASYSGRLHVIAIFVAIAVLMASVLVLMSVLDTDLNIRHFPFGLIKPLGIVYLGFELLGFSLISHGIPWAINKVDGEPFTRMAISVTQKEALFGRSSHCYLIKSSDLPDDGLGRICVTKSVYEAIHPGDLIYVSGIRSWIGIQVDRYDYPTPPARAGE